MWRFAFNVTGLLFVGALLIVPIAHAQQAMTLDLGRNVPWEGNSQSYAPIPFQVRVSDAPEGAWNDGAIVAWKDGWLEIGGQVMVVLDHTQPPPQVPNFTFRIWDRETCQEHVWIRPEYPRPSQAGHTNPWWVAFIPINMAIKVHRGDRVYPCLYATTNNPDGATTNYLDGNPAHTRLHVMMRPH